jgi:flagellar assembly protein FliH
MSSRARVVDGQAPVARFEWGAEPDATAPRPSTPARTLAAAVPAPQSPEMPAAEQQAHLAALERDAFAKGYAQGERAGVEAGGKRTEAMLRRVAQTLEDLSQLRRTIVRETERQMVQLALALARRIVTREVTLDPTLVAAMAHVALERIGETAPATIRLHPDDYVIVAGQRGEQWEGAQVRILPDPAIARGGCHVESAFGVVDGSLDAQFEEMTRALLGDATVAPPEAGSDGA